MTRQSAPARSTPSPPARPPDGARGKAGAPMDQTLGSGSERTTSTGEATMSNSRRLVLAICLLGCARALPAVVLYDQYTNASGAANDFDANSQDYNYDDQTADDFVVPGGQTWSVNEVD